MGGRRRPVWLRLVLALYPRPFREAHADEVMDFVEAEGGSVFARVGQVLDLVRGAWRARRSAAKRERAGSAGVVDVVGRDVRLAVRSLGRAPGHTVAVVLTLAVGIGLSVAMFSVLNAVLLRPLPFADPDRLVLVRGGIASADNVGLAGGVLTRVREQTAGFEEVAGIARIRQNLTGPPVPRQVEVVWASANLFELLGVRAAVGRTFRAGDPMGTAVLGHAAWLRDFGGDPAAVGGTIQLDGYPYTVVGVLPPGFRLDLAPVSREIDVWKVPDPWWQNGDVWGQDGAEFGILRLVGRLRPGVGLRAARADLDRVATRLHEEYAQYRTDDFRFVVDPLHAYAVSRARPILLLLMAAVVAVLLIVCANVTGLMMVRSEGRTRDITVRRALGAGRRRIVAQVLAESGVVAATGGALGLLVGWLGARLIPRLAPADVPRLAEVSLDARVLGFVLTITLASTLLFGLAPALRTAGLATLEDARRTTGRAGGRFRRGLVMAQLAASTVLLICASLMATSMARLEDVDPGFRTDDVHTFAVSLPGTRYARPEGTDLFFRRLHDRITGLPGVEAAGVVWPLPLVGQRWDAAYHGGRVREEDRRLARYELVTPEYFATLDIPLLRGRNFGTDDPRRTVIVSRTLADRAWPGLNPISRLLRATPWGQDTVHFEVIGVAADTRYATLREPPGDVIYFASAGYSWTDWEVSFVVRADVPPAALTSAIRRELAALDPAIPLASPRPLQDVLDAELATGRFARTLFVLFAGVAAFLAALGLYGVVSWGVRRRRRELGIRLALGSGNGGIVGLVLREGIALSAVGLALGVTLAVAATRLLRSMLFGVSATEPRIYAGAVAGLATVALLATLLPALRATRLDPVEVIRAD